MAVKDNGRYCQLCSRTIIDFTGLSDGEIVRLIEQSSGKLCGRFSQHQLLRSLEASPTSGNPLLNKMIVGLMVVGSLESSLATNRDPEMVEGSVIVNDHSLPYDRISIELAGSDTLKKVIRGVVEDGQTGEFLPFASVSINGSKYRTNTNMDGEFKLDIPGEFIEDKIIVVIEYVGYNTEFRIFDQRQLSDDIMNVQLTPVFVEPQIMGEVILIKEK